MANVNEFDGRTQWLIAGAVSLVLHVVGIGALLALNSPEKPPAVAEPPRPAAEPQTPSPAVRSEPTKDEKPVKDENPVRDEKLVKDEKPARAESSEQKAPPEKSASVDTATYVVKSGDNLTTIARKYSLTAAELSKLNGKDVKTFSRLRVGQRIRVPRPDGE